MLLDQKRTRRMVQVVSVLTSVAFAGVIFIVLGLIFFGGGGQSATDQLLSDARSRIQQQPKNPDAWEQLASAEQAANDLPAAITAAEKAVSLAPDDFSRLQVLIQLQIDSGAPGKAVDVLETYTARHPRNAQAFLQLGQLAEQAGRTALARLSYEAFLRLAPGDRNAAAVRSHLKTLK